MRATTTPPPASRAVDPAGVRAMFERIAPRYDALNRLLSAGIDRRWRRLAVDALAPRDGARYLDCCAGTLDLAAAISARAPRATVVAADFALPMLLRGRRKALAAPGAVFPLVADALRLPFPNQTFAGATIAFGLRNLSDPAAGLAELARVLAPAARLVVLEFTTPPQPVIRAVYHAYFHHVLPRIGALVSGDGEAYRYLPDSVAAFPDVRRLGQLCVAAGFRQVQWRLLTGGIAALHTAIRR
ncbi:MAG: class I SAM-dependent methyltransferase [Gemmatimonadota bacterium]